MTRRRTGHQRTRGQGANVGGIVQSPGVVRTEIRKTQSFVEALSDDVAAAYSKGTASSSLTPDQQKWFKAYGEWYGRFDQWAKENLKDPWDPLQVLATGSISDQNDQWLKEAQAKQAEFNGLGLGSSTAPAPTPLPGGSTPGGLGSFFSGMGLGTLLALGFGLWLLSENDKGGRR